MRKLLGLILLLLASSIAQATTVTGTVTDPSSIPYSNATVSAVLTPAPGSVALTINGATFPTSNFTLSNSAGTFSFILGDNTLMVPASSTWQWAITVCETLGIPAPLGTGAKCTSTTVTISGSSQDVSTLLSSAAPSLTSLITSPVSPGNVFNAKDYGAKGDTQFSSIATITATNIVNCTNCAFKQGDIGKKIYGIEAATGITRLPYGTITAVASATQATVSTTGAGSYTVNLVWGTDDTTALQNEFAAALAAQTNVGSILTSALNFPNPPTKNTNVFVPSGGYLVCNLANSLFNYNVANLTGLNIYGAGKNSTIFYPCTKEAITLPSNQNLGMLVASSNTASFFTMRDFSFNGVAIGLSAGSCPGSNALINVNGNSVRLDNIMLQNWCQSQGANGVGYLFAGSSGDIGIGIEGVQLGRALYVNGAGTLDLYDFVFSNGGADNAAINNINTSGQGILTGNVVRFHGGLIDECGTGAPACGTGPKSCTTVTASKGVWFIGTQAFAAPSQLAVCIDGTSEVNFEGGVLGPFSTDTNSAGLQVLSGGAATLSEEYVCASGTGNTINNAGTVSLIGGNHIGDNIANCTPGAGAVNTGTVNDIGANSGMNTQPYNNTGTHVQNIGGGLTQSNTQPTIGTSLVLTQVTVGSPVAGQTTYTGTITGGGSNGYAGASATFSGFAASAGVNNGTFFVLASTATTLVVTTTVQVNETHAGAVISAAVVNSPLYQLCTTYGTSGPASAADCWNEQIQIGSVAANPTSTLVFSHPAGSSGAVAAQYPALKLTGGMTSLNGNSLVGAGLTGILYNTASSAGTGSISATTMFTNVASTQSYQFSFAADQTVAGTSCTGTTTVAINVIYTDPNTSSAATVTVGTFSISANGTVGNQLLGSPVQLVAKASTVIQYSTTVTAGTGCSPAPTYQIYPRLVAI